MQVLKHRCGRSHQHRGALEQTTSLNSRKGVGLEQLPDREGRDRARRSVGGQQVGGPVLEVDVHLCKFEQGYGQSIRHDGAQLLAHLHGAVSRSPTHHTVSVR